MMGKAFFHGLLTGDAVALKHLTDQLAEEALAIGIRATMSKTAMQHLKDGILTPAEGKSICWPRRLNHHLFCVPHRADYHPTIVV